MVSTWQSEGGVLPSHQQQTPAMLGHEAGTPAQYMVTNTAGAPPKADVYPVQPPAENTYIQSPLAASSQVQVAAFTPAPPAVPSLNNNVFVQSPPCTNSSSFIQSHVVPVTECLVY